MEIDFLIMRKNQLLENSILESKVRELIASLFTDVKSDSFLYNNNADSLLSFKYKCSEIEDNAYLKISCNYSDEESAD